jgi:hypothetical protein
MLDNYLKAVRCNHALEHATIALLLARDGPMRVVGRAVSDGFYLYGRVPTARLAELSKEALERLQRGESHLAVSPLCGTNIVVAALLAGAGSYLAASWGRRGPGRLSTALLAALAGVLASQPVGRFIQKNYTTSPDLAGVRIVDVKRLGRSNVHKVRTARGKPAAA